MLTYTIANIILQFLQLVLHSKSNVETETSEYVGLQISGKTYSNLVLMNDNLN
jgi:hypothetical protein